MAKQDKIEGRKRIVVMVDSDVIRMAKAMAAHEGRSFWMIVEKALRLYLAGKLPTNGGDK
jgi:hypothetical protein